MLHNQLKYRVWSLGVIGWLFAIAERIMATYACAYSTEEAVNPYTVELSIPIYNQKRMMVVFNVLPLTSNEHYFFIDIYADLQWWLKPGLQILLHFAACLTLFEDLPYLRALSERNIEKLFYTTY